MPVDDVAPAEQAARIRAAVGYSGLEYREVAAQLEISYATLRRRTTRTDPSGAHSKDELYAIADVCGIPREFMLEGFARFHHEASTEERLVRLEALIVYFLARWFVQVES